MKKVLLSATATLAVFAFGSANAADQQVIATVEAICEATVTPGLLADFGIDPTPGPGFEIADAVILNCNDGDGATVELRSAEGHLESDDNEDMGVAYRAVLNGPGLTTPLRLTANSGVNDQSVEDSIPFSGLAGGVPYSLGFQLLETPLSAGGYSDTLSVEIQAN